MVNVVGVLNSCLFESSEALCQVNERVIVRGRCGHGVDEVSSLGRRGEVEVDVLIVEDKGRGLTLGWRWRCGETMDRNRRRGGEDERLHHVRQMSRLIVKRLWRDLYQ